MSVSRRRWSVSSPGFRRRRRRRTVQSASLSPPQSLADFHCRHCRRPCCPGRQQGRSLSLLEDREASVADVLPPGAVDCRDVIDVAMTDYRRCPTKYKRKLFHREILPPNNVLPTANLHSCYSYWPNFHSV